MKEKNSFGKKFGLLCVMLLILLIPIAFLFGIVTDRVSYNKEATDKVKKSWAEQQVIAAPNLIVKEHNQSIKSDEKDNNNKINEISLKLNDYNVNVNVQTEFRKKGIYKIPVYTADVDIKGDFINDGSLYNKPVKLDIKVTDSRGFITEPEIKLNEKIYNYSEITDYTNKLSISEQRIPFEIKYKIRGIEKLSVIPNGVSNKININGNWGNPSFEGDFLPVTKEVKADNFNAQWSIPQIATSSIANPRAGVSFLNPVDNYSMATRALKYAFMFLGLSFMTYFIYEISYKNRNPIHYLQYLMMGVAMLIFYLLLVSMSEFISFIWAYIIAAVMTIGLIGMYTYFVITKRENKMFSLLITGILALLYIFLYVLLSLQDFALVIGSFGLFMIMALVMYSTRNVDWYGNKGE